MRNLNVTFPRFHLRLSVINLWCFMKFSVAYSKAYPQDPSSIAFDTRVEILIGRTGVHAIITLLADRGESPWSYIGNPHFRRRIRVT